MSLIPVTRLHTIATEILTAIVDQFADASIDLPARQYVHVGAIAHDCEQLVVTSRQIARGHPTRDLPDIVRNQCDTRVLHLEASLIRCVPTQSDSGAPPGADALDGSADLLLRDGWTLTHGLELAKYDGEMGGVCRKLSVGTATAVGPDGGFAGWTVPLQIEID